jgi:hypothetical protein
MDGDFHAKRGSFRIWNRLFARVRARKNEMIRRGVYCALSQQHTYACDLCIRRELFGCLTRCNMPHKLLCE